MQTLSSRVVFKIVWPLIIEQLFLVLIGVVNTIMSSNISPAAVSAVSYIDALNQLIIAGFTAVATGATVVISQYRGRKDIENAVKTAGQSILSIASISVIVSIGMLIFGRPLSIWLLGTAETEVLENAAVYLTSSSISLFFFGIYSASSGILRGYGITVKSMRISVIMNIVNAIVGATLVYGFKFGVLGVGIALIAARFAGAAFAMFTLLSDKSEYRMKSIPRRFDIPMLKTIMAMGVPIAIESVLFFLGRFLVQVYVVQMGTLYMSVYAISNSISSMIMIPNQALSFASVTVVGICIGAGNIDEAKKHLKNLAYVCTGVLLLEFLIIVVFPTLPYIVGLYKPSEEILNLVAQFLTVNVISAVLVWAPAFIYASGFRGAGDVRFTTIIALTTMFAIRVVAGYVLGVTFKLYTLGIAIAMALDWVARAIIFMIRYFRGDWLKNKVI